MNIWQALIYGAVQGFTEFLPVSSSGHLYVLGEILGVDDSNFLLISIFLHVCTLVPVCIVFFKDIIGLFKKPFDKLLWLVVATIPAAIVGVVFEVAGGESLFGGGLLYVICGCFTFTAIMLLFIQRYAHTHVLDRKLNLKSGFFMGLGQALGTIPGISRSGITISSGTLCKLDGESNATFSFLMSIPLILGSAVVTIYKGATEGWGDVSVLPLLVSGAMAMLCGYVSIRFMFGIIKKAKYSYFSGYLCLLAVTLVILKATAVL